MSPASVPAPGGPAPASRLAGLLAAALDSIFTFDSGQRLLEFNPAAERTFGYRVADVVGRSLADIILPASGGGADFFRVLMEGTAEQRGQRVETTARRADGSEFPCEITIARFEENGQPLFTALLRDLTERRRTERRIRELTEGLERDVAARTAELSAAIKALEVTRARLETAQEIAHVGDVQVNLSTGARIWSDEVFRLYGYEPAEAAPSWEEVLTRIHPDDQQRCNFMLGQAMRGHVPEPIDYRVVRRDGSVRWIQATGRHTEGMLALSLADVTDRKTAEQQLVAMVERERELGRLKADFVYTVTHEYRTPLSVVLSSAEILERYLDRLSAEERVLHVREIRVHARRLADLVDEVLFLGRMDAGSVDLDLGPVDLRGLMREVTSSTVLALGAERTVHFECDSVPPRVLLDERLLRHIVSNLVHNALKYSTLDRSVWTDVRAFDGEIILRVRDEGIGIPEADQARLFQSFQRASNVGTISGSGLGLVVVKRCVEMHGGTIAFRSVVGEGTEFTVRLPLALPAARPAEGPPARRATSPARGPAKKSRPRQRGA